MRRTRRQFMQTTAGSSAMLAIGASAPNVLLKAAEQAGQQGERVLVVVQLSGGNDGLNTVVPHTDEAYRRARPTLAISKRDALTIDDSTGFHPEMRGFAKLLEDDQLAVIQGVGYANPNRSHFESMDIWHTCKRKGEIGWMVRPNPRRVGRSINARRRCDAPGW